MTALKNNDPDRLIAKPDGRYPVVLIYGPDAGLVSERASALAANAVDDRNDPFQTLRLDGDEIASDPLRLADEANTKNMFGGGRHAIHVRVGARNLTPLIEPLLRAPPQDAIVILEAGELRKTSPLLALCEKSPNAAAISCYADDAKTLRALVDDTLRTAGISIEAEAHTLLLSMLGGDRRATRGELDKLIAFAGESARLGVADVEAAVGDAGAIAVDNAVDAAFSGQAAPMLAALGKLVAAGTRADSVLIPALNHAWLLAQGLAQIAGGQSARGFIDQRVRGPYTRKDAVARQLDLWTRSGLDPIIEALGDSILAARKQSDLGPSHADRIMLRIALAARKQK